MDDQILALFGLSVEQLAVVSGVTLAIVEWLKSRFPEVFTGWVTTLSAFGVSALVSLKLVYPDWEKVLALTVISVLLSGGAKLLIKKAGIGTS